MAIGQGSNIIPVFNDSSVGIKDMIREYQNLVNKASKQPGCLSGVFKCAAQDFTYAKGGPEKKLKTITDSRVPPVKK